MISHHRSSTRQLDWAVVARFSPIIRFALLATLVAALLAPVPNASAASTANCGKAIINEYFYTGRIAYHTQNCYASALKQLDPDAKMYSGIMGALRAARARDKAADSKPPDSAGSNATDVAVAPAAPTDAVPLPDVVVPLVTNEEPPVTAAARSGDITPATTTQAVIAVPTIESRVPLGVILLGGLASVLTLVGVGGLAVRWLDQSA